MLIIFRKISLIFFLLLSFTFVCNAVNEPEVSASSAILIDGDTCEVLYEKNAHKKRSMASTTKIMTSLIAIESGQLEDTVTVKEKLYIEGTAIGFNKGDALTLKALCYAMLLESGNDAAVLTAKYLSGGEESFSKLMNKKAAEIGMRNTNFVTASGLDDAEHYTTAYDMALLGAYAINNGNFREICSSKTYKAEFINPDVTRYFSNHNRLLSSCDGAIGIKTGFTKKSGRCLVSACERNGKVLVAVTLNAPDDWNDHRKLYDYGYSLYDTFTVTADIPTKLTVTGSDKSCVYLNATGDLTGLALKNSTVSTKIYLKQIAYAPVKKQDIQGKIVVLQNEHPIYEQQIISGEDADAIKNFKIYKPTTGQRIVDFFKNLFKKEGR